MKAFIARLVALGPFGVFLVAFLDSTGIPIVGGVDALIILVSIEAPAQGYLCAGLAILGSLMGSLILFYLARKGGEKYLDKVAGGARGMKFRRWFAKYGLVTVFVPALSVVPMPLKAFVACAGVLGIRPLSFAVTVLAARVPRYLFLAWLGQEMGKDALKWVQAHTIEFVAGLAVVAAIFFLIARFANRSEDEVVTV